MIAANLPPFDSVRVVAVEVGREAGQVLADRVLLEEVQQGALLVHLVLHILPCKNFWQRQNNAKDPT